MFKFLMSFFELLQRVMKNHNEIKPKSSLEFGHLLEHEHPKILLETIETCAKQVIETCVTQVSENLDLDENGMTTELSKLLQNHKNLHI